MDAHARLRHGSLAGTVPAVQSGGMRQPSRRELGLAALSLVGLALFGYPLLAVVDGGTGPLGIPALFVYLYGVWALLVTLTVLLRR